MKIKVYEVACNVGYAMPIFRGIHRSTVQAEIAKACREDWRAHSWERYWAYNEQPWRSDPPLIPGTDAEVIATYFYDTGNPDLGEGITTYAVYESQFELDLSPESGVPIDLPVDGYFRVTRCPPDQKGSVAAGATTEGTLLWYTGSVGDALEGFVLALTAAGFPVHLPEFKDCLQGYCENLVNQLVDVDLDALKA